MPQSQDGGVGREVEVTAPFYMALPHVAATAFDDAATIGKRLPPSLVYMLLAGLADRALRPYDASPFPTVGVIARHVGWSHTGIAALLVEPSKWLHPDHHRAWAAYWTATSKARTPKRGGESLSTHLPLAFQSLSTDFPPDAGPTDVLGKKVSAHFPGTFQPLSVRLIRALRSDARARSDRQTVRPSDNEKKAIAADAAPSPATTTDDQETLDLLASLESRPTVATTIDTPAATDTANTSGGDPCATRTDSEAGGTPSPVPAHPSPVASPQDAGTIPAPEVAPASSAPGAARKGKGKGKGGPSPEAVAAWPAAITWWATLNPSNAGRLKMERGDGAALLKALDSQGVDVIMGRLRQASVGTCYMARQVRGEVPGRDRVDALSTLLWERTGITAPLDSAAEAEGYDTVSAPSYGLASVPGASDVSEHVQTPGALAWADLRAQAWHGPDAQKRWREIERSGPHFVWADGYHLAGERVEHEKRCRAWRAAGGLVGWTDDQRAFQQRFVEAYDAVAVAA